ncbi:cytochrome B [Xaviernesmea oryzae]|uniref:Cytochrome B n=1 Tax=Xaviernesmea oryzae TaxID=464029 RepID=A0A1Q9ARS0_9HYPH|nr:cytochrome b/b6 domain-containing protein [Xaviernesmea oryzae]OLP58100.1 cytochrome B [Xaviernesmea oryzae]SEL82854.1 Cytochrome b [Xaviernesmea oryzae]
MTATPSTQDVGKPDGDLPSGAKVRVWDPVVRLFHWGVVAGCALNLFMLRPGKLPHRYVGYAIAGLLALRILWGFIGTRHARFADFVRGPRTVAVYLGDVAKRREARYRGHNPAASVVMLLLMTLLAGTALTGWMQTLDAFWGEDWVSAVHETLANAIMVIAGFHIAAAIIESLRHRENLIWSMITGRKRA